MEHHSEIIGGVTTYSNNKLDVQKDPVTQKLIPDQISECALYLGKKPGETCVTDTMAKSIGLTIGVSGDSEKIMETAKGKLGCNTEICVLGKLESKLGQNAVKSEIKKTMKVNGPTSTKLLSNSDIDSTLQQWALRFTDFFPYNFNMINYASYSFHNGDIHNRPDSLATILWRDLYSGEFDGRKYRCCGCVINSDKYQGGGKHWMSLFADARNPRRWTVEFFNSSGNAPAPEWINWLVKTRDQMEQIAEQEHKKVKVEIIKVCQIRHQHSRTECGVYSLFHIWARLNNQPPEYFIKKPVPDQLMMEFRQHLFADPKKPFIGEFNFSDYAKHTKIEWE